MVDDKHQADDAMDYGSAGRTEASEEEEDRQPVLSGRQICVPGTLSAGGANGVDNAEGIRARALAYGTKAVAVSSNKQLTSKFRGVCWNKKNKRWQAAINSSGKYLYLGSYNTEAEAAAVFDKAAIRIRGLKARLNFCYSDYVDASGKIREDHVIDDLLRDACNPTKGRRNRTVSHVAVLTEGSPPPRAPLVEQDPLLGGDSPAVPRSGRRRRRAAIASAAGDGGDSDDANRADEQELSAPPLRRQRRARGTGADATAVFGTHSGDNSPLRRNAGGDGTAPVGMGVGAAGGGVGDGAPSAGCRRVCLPTEAGSGNVGAPVSAAATLAPGGVSPAGLEPVLGTFAGRLGGARDELDLNAGGGYSGGEGGDGDDGCGLIEPHCQMGFAATLPQPVNNHHHHHQYEGEHLQQQQHLPQLHPDPHYPAHGPQSEVPSGGILYEPWSAEAAAVQHPQAELHTVSTGNVQDAAGNGSEPFAGGPGPGPSPGAGAGAVGSYGVGYSPFMDLSRAEASLQDQMAQLHAEQASLVLARLRSQSSGRAGGAAFEMGPGRGLGRGSLGGCGDAAAGGDGGGGGGRESMLELGDGLGGGGHRLANSKLQVSHRLECGGGGGGVGGGGGGGRGGGGQSSRVSEVAELLMNVMGDGGGGGGLLPPTASSMGWGNGSLAARLWQSPSAQMGIGRGATQYDSGGQQQDLLEQLSQQGSFLSNLGLGVLAAAHANAVAAGPQQSLHQQSPNHQPPNHHSHARQRMGEGEMARLLQPDPEPTVAVAGVSSAGTLGLPFAAGSSAMGGGARPWANPPAGFLHGGGGAVTAGLHNGGGVAASAAAPGAERIGEAALQLLKHHPHHPQYHHLHHLQQQAQAQQGAPPGGHQQHRRGPSWAAAALSSGRRVDALHADHNISPAALQRPPPPHDPEAEGMRQVAADLAGYRASDLSHQQPPGGQGHKAGTPPGQGGPVWQLYGRGGAGSAAIGGDGALDAADGDGGGSGSRRDAAASGGNGSYQDADGEGDMFSQIHRALPAGCSLDVVIPSSLPNVVGVLYRQQSGPRGSDYDGGGGLTNAAVWNGRVQRLRLLGKFGSESEAKASCQAALAMLRDTMPQAPAAAGDGGGGGRGATAQKGKHAGVPGGGSGRHGSGGTGSKDGGSFGRGGAGGGGTAAAAAAMAGYGGGDNRIDRHPSGAAIGPELDLSGSGEAIAGGDSGGPAYPSYKVVVPSSDELSYSQLNSLQLLPGNDPQSTPSSHQLLAITRPMHHGGLHAGGDVKPKPSLDPLGYRLESVLLGRMGIGAGGGSGNRPQGAGSNARLGFGVGVGDNGAIGTGGDGSRNSAVTHFMHGGNCNGAATAMTAAGVATGELPMGVLGLSAAAAAETEGEGELTDESVVTERRQGREGSGTAGMLGFGGGGALWSKRSVPRGPPGLLSIGGEGSGGYPPNIADSGARSGSGSHGSGGRYAGSVHAGSKEPQDDAFTEAAPVTLRAGAGGGGACGQRPRGLVSGSFGSEFAALTQLANVDVQEALQLFINQQQQR